MKPSSLIWLKRKPNRKRTICNLIYVFLDGDMGWRKGAWRANIDVRYTDNLQFSGTAAMTGAHVACISRLSAATSCHYEIHRNCIHSISATHRQRTRATLFFNMSHAQRGLGVESSLFRSKNGVGWLNFNVCVRTHTPEKSRIQCLRFVENIDVYFSSTSRRPKYWYADNKWLFVLCAECKRARKIKFPCMRIETDQIHHLLAVFLLCLLLCDSSITRTG